MRKLFSIFLSSLFLILLFANFTNAKEINVHFAWDAYADIATYGVTKIMLFQSTTPGTYDFNAPIAVVPQTADANGNGMPSDFTVPINFPDGQNTTYYWTSTAVNDQGLQSDPSNEVSKTVNLTPLPYINDLAAAYNKDTESIDFSWTQNDSDRVKSWKLFQSLTAGGPYNEAAAIDWDGTSTDIAASVKINQAPGTTVDYYFVVVSYGDYGVYSPNSNEVKVTITRRPTPSKVMNLKVTIEQ